MVNTPKVQTPLMVEGQQNAHILFNEWAVKGDSMVGMPKLKTHLAASAPTSNINNGDLHTTHQTTITPGDPWDGHANSFALYNNGWLFFPMFEVIAWDDVSGIIVYYDGAAWNNLAGGGGALDGTAIHKTTPSEFVGVPLKAGTPHANDILLIEDSQSSNAKKRILISQLPSGGGTPPDASETVKGIIEIATTAEVSALSDSVRAVTPATLGASTFGVKVTGIEAGAQVNLPVKQSVEIDVGAIRLLNDQAAPGNTKYYGTNGGGSKGWYDIPAGPPSADVNAVHVGTADEIHLITQKVTPVPSDVLIIEDSAASWNKKRVTVSDLVGSGSIVYNIYDYGSPVGDSAADGVAIQAAHDAAKAAGGGTVYVPPVPSGKTAWRVLDRIEWDGNDVHLMCDGGAILQADALFNQPGDDAVGEPGIKTIFHLGPVGAFADQAVSSRQRISGLRLDGNSGAADYGLYVRNAEDAIIEHIDVRGTAVSGVDCGYSRLAGINGRNYRNNWSHIYSHFNDGAGIILRGERECSAHNLRSINNLGNGIEVRPYFFDNGANGHQVAMVHSNITNVISQNNTGDGFVADSMQRVGVSNLLIENNDGYGIRLTTGDITVMPTVPTGTNDVRWTNVVIRYNTLGGIFQDDGSWFSNGRFENINIWGDTTDAAQNNAIGIWIKGATNVVFSNVSIIVIGGACIRLSEGHQDGIPAVCRYVTFSDVDLWFNGITTGPGDIANKHGIWLDGGNDIIKFVNVMSKNELTNSVNGYEVFIDNSTKVVANITDIYFIGCQILPKAQNNGESISPETMAQVHSIECTLGYGAVINDQASTTNLILPALSNKNVYRITGTGTVNSIALRPDGTRITILNASAMTYGHSVTPPANFGRINMTSGGALGRPALGMTTFVCRGGFWYTEW